MDLLSQPLGLSPLPSGFRTNSTRSFHGSNLVLPYDCKPPPPILYGRARALKTANGEGSGGIRSQEPYNSHLLKNPEDLSQERNVSSDLEEERNFDYLVSDEDYESEDWSWEERILKDTVPLVGYIRTILHTGKYQSGDRLTAEHESFILEELLPFHPEFQDKIGCGVDYITIGFHPIFRASRCFFIIRKDGGKVDFSYWKCIKGLIRQNYPSHADSFIHRHFRHGRHMPSGSYVAPSLSDPLSRWLRFP